MALTDQSIHSALATLVTIVATGGLIALLVSRLGSSRPGFAVGLPAAVAFGLRVVFAGVISLTSVAQTLRGGDELTFLVARRRSPRNSFWIR